MTFQINLTNRREVTTPQLSWILTFLCSCWCCHFYFILCRAQYPKIGWYSQGRCFCLEIRIWSMEINSQTDLWPHGSLWCHNERNVHSRNVWTFHKQVVEQCWTLQNVMPTTILQSITVLCLTQTFLRLIVLHFLCKEEYILLRDQTLFLHTLNYILYGPPWWCSG